MSIEQRHVKRNNRIKDWEKGKTSEWVKGSLEESGERARRRKRKREKIYKKIKKKRKRKSEQQF